MTLISFSPPWFYGYDVLLEIGFTITALIIAFFAFRIYRATDQQPVKLFGISFGLISLAYLIQSVLNSLIIAGVDSTACGTAAQRYVGLFGTYGLYAHMLLMTAGLALLAFMTFKTDKMRVFWVMLIVSAIAIMFGASPLHSFFAISSLLLAIVLWHFISSYRQTRQGMTLLVVLAFGFLLFGSLHFMLSVDHELYYAIGHVLELIAYVLILVNLYLVRHGKKT